MSTHHAQASEAVVQAARLLGDRLFPQSTGTARLLDHTELASLTGDGLTALRVTMEGAVDGELTLLLVPTLPDRPGAGDGPSDAARALTDAVHAMSLVLGPLVPAAPEAADAREVLGRGADASRLAAAWSDDEVRFVILLGEAVAGAEPAPVVPSPAVFRPFAPAAPLADVDPRRLHLLRDVEMGISVELGRTRMTVQEVLGLAPGVVIELDRAAGSPVDVLVNGTLIARGEVVVVDEEFAVRVTEVLSPDLEGRLGA